MDVLFIIRFIFKTLLYYTQIHQPGLSSQMPVAPRFPRSSCASFDIANTQLEHTYNTRLKQGAMDSFQSN